MGVKTALYRHFDIAGQLLYVGISLSAVHRLSQHKSTARWFADIKRVDVEHHPTRAAAMKAESIAIRAEAPRFNRQGVKPVREQPAAHTFAIEHARSLRRDGNYCDADLAAEVLADFRAQFPKDEFRIVTAPKGSAGGATSFHPQLRPFEANLWSASAA